MPTPRHRRSPPDMGRVADLQCVAGNGRRRDTSRRDLFVRELRTCARWTRSALDRYGRDPRVEARVRYAPSCVSSTRRPPRNGRNDTHPAGRGLPSHVPQQAFVEAPPAGRDPRADARRFSSRCSFPKAAKRGVDFTKEAGRSLSARVAGFLFRKTRCTARSCSKAAPSCWPVSDFRNDGTLGRSRQAV
jgi:hypothetical protein